MSQEALSEQQFPKPKPQRIKGYYYQGITEEGEHHPHIGGTLCPTCYKHTTKGHTWPNGSVTTPTQLHDVRPIRGGDSYDLDVCNDCGKTIRMGRNAR